MSIDGTGTASGAVTVTSASTLGMAAGGFAALPPSRLLDTRTTGTPLGSDQTRSLKVTGVGGVPSTGVSAVVLNVTVTQTTGLGYLTVSPTGTTRPLVSNLNWSTGTTIPNAVTVKVGTGGSIDLYQSGPGTAQVIVDVTGYYIDGTVTQPGGFNTLTPARILDTRNTGGTLASDTTRDLQVTELLTVRRVECSRPVRGESTPPSQATTRRASAADAGRRSPRVKWKISGSRSDAAASSYVDRYHAGSKPSDGADRGSGDSR